MNMQRRTFLQVLGALGISIAAPLEAAAQIKLDPCKQPVNFTEGGRYALMAFHRDWIDRRSLFHRVPFEECKRVMYTHGVQEGNHIWAKFPLMGFTYNKDLTRLYVPGGQSPKFAATKIVYAEDGQAFAVVKDRKIGLTDKVLSVPSVLHTTVVPMLHPMNNMFNEDAEFGEIRVTTGQRPAHWK